MTTKSSTKAELVGIDDVLTWVIWIRYLIKEQGYTILNNIIYQDNQSALKIEKNDRRLISKKTKHINIIYYLSLIRS